MLSDEPTSALDAETLDEVLDVMVALAADGIEQDEAAPRRCSVAR